MCDPTFSPLRFLLNKNPRWGLGAEGKQAAGVGWGWGGGEGVIDDITAS